MDAAARNQTRVFVLVVLAFLPAVGLYWYASASARDAAITAREQELLQFVHVSAVEYQRLVDESESILGALTAFPEIREGGPACSRRLADVLEHTPHYTTLSHIGIDGYVTCGSLTVDGDLYLGDRAYFRLAAATNRFSVGNYAVGRITGLPTVGLAYPIPTAEGTSVASVLALSLNLSKLGNQASRMNIPDGATFTVLDQKGTVMIRVPEGVSSTGADTVGSVVTEAFIQLPQVLRSPHVERATDLDGVARLIAIAPLRGGGSRANGYVIVGVDEAQLSEASDAVALSALRFLGMAGLAVLLLAWLFGHYALVKPVRVTA